MERLWLIVGFEADQVMKTPEGDKSVPITWAYLSLSEAYTWRDFCTEMRQGHSRRGAQSWTHLRTKFGTHSKAGYCGSNTLTQASLHLQWLLKEMGVSIENHTIVTQKEKHSSLSSCPPSNQPMQIDTKTGLQRLWLPPWSTTCISAAPPNASYSGLLECPLLNKNTQKHFCFLLHNSRIMLNRNHNQRNVLKQQPKSVKWKM